MPNTHPKAKEEFADFTPYKTAKGEEYMNDDQLEHFRQILLGWKQEPRPDCPAHNSSSWSRYWDSEPLRCCRLPAAHLPGSAYSAAKECPGSIRVQIP